MVRAHRPPEAHGPQDWNTAAVHSGRAVSSLLSADGGNGWGQGPGWLGCEACSGAISGAKGTEVALAGDPRRRPGCGGS